MLSILLSLAFFMFLILLLNFLIDEVDRTSDADHLNCSSPDTDGDKILCLIVDGTIPMYLISGLGAIGAYIAGRLL